MKQNFIKQLEILQQQEEQLINNNQGKLNLNSTQLLDFVRQNEYGILSKEERQITIEKYDIKLMDIKVGVKDYQEDQLFANSQIIHQNIRRGLSIIQFNKEIFIARKGLKKFFDIQFKQDFQLKDQEKALQQYTLGNVQQKLQQNQEINILVQEKANGKNAQITYCKQLDKWIVASKNVSHIIGANENITKTVQQIEELWKKELLKIQNVQELQNLLSDKTLVAELCGDQMDQHLVDYKELHLRCFALVGKDSEETCLNPLDSRALIQSFGLQCVKQKEFTVKNLDEFNQKLNEIQKEISLLSVKEAGEGVVIYFCDQQGNCISLGKLKTLEYRLERKLREKLRSCINGEATAVSLFEKYKQESTKLIEDIKIEYDLKESFQFAKLAFTFCWNFSRSKPKPQMIKEANQLLQHRYLDFLQLVRKNINQDKQDIIGLWIQNQVKQQQKQQ